MKIKIHNKEYELKGEEVGKRKTVILPLKITVEENSFLHINASPSPLTEKKGAVLKIGHEPFIPASSFKGALRYQMEQYFIEKEGELAAFLGLKEKDKEMLKPCIPAASLTKAELELINKGLYRNQIKPKKKDQGEPEGCWIEVTGNNIDVPTLGICPVCYFMGAAGIMGFLRISNFLPERNANIIDHTRIRIDRKTHTAAGGAKVEMESVAPKATFTGHIEIEINSFQGFTFGEPRKISLEKKDENGNKNEKILDKWLASWSEKDPAVKAEEKAAKLIEEIIWPSIERVKILGGMKSSGAGSVNVSLM